MTYNAEEISTESGQPVEVYTFTDGGTQYRYTSSVKAETVGVLTFQPRAISRGDVADGPDEHDNDFSITLPSSDAVAQLFAGLPPIGRVRVLVQRFHRGDGSSQLQPVFEGYIHVARYSDNWRTCTLIARSLFSPMGRQTPARTYQGLCNHRLYDPTTCKVDDTNPAFRASAKTVTGAVGNVLTVAGLGSFTSGTFVGGYVEDATTGENRLILADDGAGNLTLLLPFTTLPSTVNVFVGCDHLIETCNTKFSNILNFGGFAFVPIDNPFSDGLQ